MQPTPTTRGCGHSPFPVFAPHPGQAAGTEPVTHQKVVGDYSASFPMIWFAAEASTETIIKKTLKIRIQLQRDPDDPDAIWRLRSKKQGTPPVFYLSNASGPESIALFLRPAPDSDYQGGADTPPLPVLLTILAGRYGSPRGPPRKLLDVS